MNKITVRLISYFTLIIALTVILCFVASGIFLSRFFREYQYDSLESYSRDIYSGLKRGEAITDNSIGALLVQDGNVSPLTQSRMGMMPFLRAIGPGSLGTKGSTQNSMGVDFLYYKLETELGDIVVFQNDKFSYDYLKVVYLILFIIFVSGMLLSIPLISFLGRRFTKPILQLETAASSISRGDFNIDLNIKTRDEIETLSDSLEKMASELQKKYQLQRDFIANVSHDFKTPLSVIRSYNEAINDGIVDEEDARKYSGEVIREVDRLNNLVMDILQLSKLQDGAYSLNKSDFNLQELLRECMNLFEPITSKRGITLVSSVKPAQVLGDRKYLHRVICNFLDNAVKFSPDNSSIEVFTSESSEGLRLSVKDYGAGIEKHLLGDIWDKYYKNSQSGGMGLGLPICREILKMHGFEYGVTSSPESGTEFYFIIPRNSIQ